MNDMNAATDLIDTNPKTATKDVTAKKPFLPPRWVIRAAWAIHRLIYRGSRGRSGLSLPKGDEYGTLRLRSIGRRTGRERSAILGYFLDGPNLVTLAMNGWGEPEPAWWLNLQAHPARSWISWPARKTWWRAQRSETSVHAYGPA
ncbi:MAG: nitroreductase/quinone reductase family protein [Chloroflexota bacterium]